MEKLKKYQCINVPWRDAVYSMFVTHTEFSTLSLSMIELILTYATAPLFPSRSFSHPTLHYQKIYSFSRDQSFLYTVGGSTMVSPANDQLKVWNTATGACVRMLHLPNNTICCVAISPDDKLLAVIHSHKYQPIALSLYAIPTMVSVLLPSEDLLSRQNNVRSTTMGRIW